MSKVVLVQKSSSVYDDEAGIHYHFPNRQYLKRVSASQNNWAVFFSPVKDTGVSKERRGCYFAVAQLGEVKPDPNSDSHSYIDIVQSTYADFSTPVPRMVDGRFVEPKMEGKDGKANIGTANHAVRHISDEVFEKIIGHAWSDVMGELPRVDELSDGTVPKFDGVSEVHLPFEFEVERDIVTSLTNRKKRDPRFRCAVLNAYEKRCAITGWSFVNGGGRAEVEAAHIRPVENNGPDRISNGLALSGTVHWMFDRGLIGVAESDEILISHKVNDRDSIERLLHPSKKLVRPRRPEHQPHPAFLKWHRDFHNLAA